MSKTNVDNDAAESPGLTEVPDRNGVYRAAHDPDGPAALSNTVIEAIADVAGVDPTQTVVPLADSIDPDALDALFVGAEGDVRITFTVFGLEVLVWSDGEVRIVDDPVTDAE